MSSLRDSYNKIVSRYPSAGFLLDPIEAKEGINLFTGADKTEAEVARDLYFSNNPDKLLLHTNDSLRLIILSYGSPEVIEFNSIVNGIWQNTFDSTVASVDLGLHSVTELIDVTSVGSGKIISDEERNKIGENSEGIAQLENNKQDSLESSVNIKTVNSQSLLGPGDITVTGEDSRTTWILETDTFLSPSFAYASVLVDVNSSGEITPIILGGTEPFTNWEISSGTLPSEFSFNQNSGVISYNTTSNTGTGSFSVIATNPVGPSTPFTVNWEIRQAQGRSEFLNSLNPYPFMRISTFNADEAQYYIKMIDFAGRTASPFSGTIIEDSAYPIYVADNSDGTWNYMILPYGNSYWMLFANCTTDPSYLSDGYVSDINISKSYDLVCPATNGIVFDGVNYPSDLSDVHWGAALNYINFGNDSSLDNILTKAGDFSFGFTLDEPWLRDGMARSLFTREGRNWMSICLGHVDSYSNMIFGNGSSRSYDSSEVTSIPTNGFPIGTKIRVTLSGTTLSFYADGVKYYDYNISAYWDSASANSLDLQFANAVNSNVPMLTENYEHTNWQGLISRLWISNGTVESVDDDGVNYPPSVTHSWELDETEGSLFTPSNGSVYGNGVK